VIAGFLGAGSRTVWMYVSVAGRQVGICGPGGEIGLDGAGPLGDPVMLDLHRLDQFLLEGYPVAKDRPQRMVLGIVESGLAGGCV